MKPQQKKKWIVEAYTPVGIIQYNPKHDTREQAEKHKAELEKKDPQTHFGIIEESLVEERNKAVFGED